MRVSEIYLLLKEIYPEANDILGEINQNGVYLYLQKISPMAHQRDKAHFRLFCSAVTYDKSAVSLIEYLDELRERAIRAFGAFGEDIVANIEFENYDEFSGHYGYAINLEVTAFRDIKNRELKEWA